MSWKLSNRGGKLRLVVAPVTEAGLRYFFLDLDPNINSTVLLLLRVVSKRKSRTRHHDLVRINE